MLGIQSEELNVVFEYQDSSIPIYTKIYSGIDSKPNNVKNKGGNEENE